jgi:chromosome segregation ATPase
MSLFGNVWFARVGIAVLVVAAAVAVRAAWDEVGEARLYGHGQLLAAEKHHQELLVETRQSATIVREVLRSRNAVLAETLASVRLDLAASRAELVQQNKAVAEQLRTVSTLRGDLAAARMERDELTEDVGVLLDRVELLEGTAESGSAEVLNLPRRVRRPQRHESWGTTELPSVAEMVQLDLATPATPVWKQA